MTATRQQLIDAARSLIGTPFVHAQRTPGLRGGCDCSGLLVLVARICGLSVHDDRRYARDVDPRQLRTALETHCDQVPVDDAEPGDVLAFFHSRRGKEQHVGLVTKPGWMVHANQLRDDSGRVREEELGDWGRRIVSAWRLKGVT